MEKAGHAAIPPTATCGNCHGGASVKEGATLGQIHPTSTLLQPVRDSLDSAKWGENDGEAIRWERVHDLPDFVYFNHSAHITAGISCVSCHGRIDKMEVVTQVEPLSMKWCLDCHRAPENHLRDPALVTDLAFKPTDPETGEEISQLKYGRMWKEKNKINPDVSCSTCHR